MRTFLKFLILICMHMKFLSKYLYEYSIFDFNNNSSYKFHSESSNTRPISERVQIWVMLLLLTYRSYGKGCIFIVSMIYVYLLYTTKLLVIYYIIGSYNNRRSYIWSKTSSRNESYHFDIIFEMKPKKSLETEGSFNMTNTNYPL